jgi:hypothetical protein
MIGQTNGRADLKDSELREWFAGQALAGILANSQYPPQGSGEPFDQFSSRVTESAYRIAAAMMSHAHKLRKESSLRPG